MGKTEREQQLIELLCDLIGPWQDGLEEPPNDASEHLPLIMESLGCRDFEPRYLAATAVSFLGPAAVETEPLLFALLDAKDDDLVSPGLSALMAVRPRSNERVRFVGRYLLDDDFSICAAVALEHYAEDIHGELDRILAMARSDRDARRSWAVRLLTRPEFSESEILPTIRSLARDESGGVSLAAIRALIERPGNTSVAIEALSELLDARVPAYRHDAAYMLGGFGTAASATAPRLADLAVSDFFEVVRRIAAVALERVRGNKKAPLPDYEGSSRAIHEEMRNRWEEYFSGEVAD